MTTTSLATDATVPADAASSHRVAERLRDVVVLTQRNLRHIAREPLRLSDVTVQPIVFTLLFVYVFGSAVVLPAGASYRQFAVAGLCSLNITTSTIGTAVGICDDLHSGVIDRFRTLPIWRPAVLIARSLADLLTAVLCIGFVVVTGLAIGWRPHGAVGSDLAALGIFLLFSYALSWGLACLGAVSRSAESAQGIGLVILLTLAVVSNALLPTEHMPTPLRQVANWNPVSAVTTIARRLLGSPNPSATIRIWPMQHPALASLAWSAALLLIFAPLATRLYRQRTTD